MSCDTLILADPPYISRPTCVTFAVTIADNTVKCNQICFHLVHARPYDHQPTMKLFAELLSDYMQRTGISDAELARHLGVRRQTIFRWREGLTQRPRQRQDVTRIADKLRLTPAERDELLLAAGFAPEARDTIEVAPSPPEATRSGDAIPLSSLTQPDSAPKQLSLLPYLKPWLLALVLVAFVLLLFALAQPASWWRQTATQMGITLPTPRVQSAIPDPALADETLILIGEFANYGGEAIGYNVAGRLQEVLRKAVAETELTHVRIEVVPEVIAEKRQAVAMAEALGASLIIWGEYDSGRTLTFLTTPSEDIEEREVQRLVSEPEDMNATINVDLPEDLQWLTWIVLGQIHFHAGELGVAEVSFTQALNHPPLDASSLAGVNYHLGLIEASKDSVDWSQVIALYGEAIDLNPGLVSAKNNRGVAYLQRQAPGDLASAEADFRETTRLVPDLASGFLNLSLTLNRLYPNDRTEALGHLLTAYHLAPDSIGVNNALCWNYSLADLPDVALSYCERAVDLDASGYSHDSRGLAYALLGRYDEAASDFEYFLAQTIALDADALTSFEASRVLWIEFLRQGDSPFSEAVLAELRQE